MFFSFSMQSLYIVIPARNEAKKILEVLLSIYAQGFRNVIVVDDGSIDETFQIAQQNGAQVLRHSINRGAGAATFTGIQAALKLGAEIIVTLDADGQHNPADLQKVIQPILEKKAEIVIGSRLLNKKDMPYLRRLFNLIGNTVTWILFGLWVSDSQSGFKAFSRQAAQKIEIKTNGFEFCSEIIREIKLKKIKYQEVPIQTQYSDYSLAKGQSFATGIKTLAKLILRSFMQ